jgi:hypothetical protein
MGICGLLQRSRRNPGEGGQEAALARRPIRIALSTHIRYVTMPFVQSKLIDFAAPSSALSPN